MSTHADRTEAVWGVANAIVRLAKAQEQANELSTKSLMLAAAQSKVTAQLEQALATKIEAEKADDTLVSNLWAEEVDGSSDSA